MGTSYQPPIPNINTAAFNVTAILISLVMISASQTRTHAVP